MKEPELEITIRYRVPLEYLDMESTLDHLRETGSADIVSVRVPKGIAKPVIMRLLRERR